MLCLPTRNHWCRRAGRQSQRTDYGRCLLSCSPHVENVGRDLSAWTPPYLRAIFAGMDMDSLKIFMAVAQQGSFAAVARDMGNDPSAISRSIALLEAELGIRLFQRSTRAMALTEAGERYLSHIAPL